MTLGLSGNVQQFIEIANNARQYKACGIRRVNRIKNIIL